MDEEALFPAIDPYARGYLEVDEVHTLYWEQCGNPDGVPVVFLHGGPGAGCENRSRRFFDPAWYRIILLDQRGSGRSRPLGETRNNSPALLVADLEALRRHCGIERWHLFGGSWGGALALMYAQAHPERCLGLVVRGVSLFEQEGLSWWFSGMGRFFPEPLEELAALAPPGCRSDLLHFYHDQLTNGDAWTRVRAARALHYYARGCASITPTPPNPGTSDDQAAHLVALYQIFLHFCRHHRFADGQLLASMNRLRGVPGVIVQGRYDVVCPVVNAFRLHRAWPDSELVIVPMAGHTSTDSGMAEALICATERFKHIR